MRSLLLIALCVLLCSPYSGSAQKKYKVTDAENSEPLSYATILFPQVSKGLYADRDGAFVIPAECQPNDSISVTMLGYLSLNTRISDLTGTILLTKTAYNMQSVVVTPKKKKKSTIVGLLNSRQSGSPTNMDGFYVSRIAVHIANKSGVSQEVDKLLYRYKQHNENIRFVVRPMVYIVNEDGSPGAPLLNKSQTIILSGKGMLEVSCEERLIFPPEGLFIALEIIEAIDNNGLTITSKDPIRYPYIFTETQNKECLTYYSLMLTEWSNYENNLFANDRVSFNAMFGLSYK